MATAGAAFSIFAGALAGAEGLKPGVPFQIFSGDVAPTPKPGTTFSILAGAPIPASSSGIVSDAFVSTDPNESLGPVFDHTATTVPLSTLGPVDDTSIKHSPFESLGPVFDHEVKEIPGSSDGPVEDSFAGTPALVKVGPVFDHDIEFFGAIPAVGPVFDGFSRKSVSSFGPVLSHIVQGQPPFLVVKDPDSVVPPDLPRDRITPEPLEVLSSGVYGLEKDEDGDVTGFKY